MAQALEEAGRSGRFRGIVETNHDATDHRQLRKLAAKVYPGGAKEITKLIDDIQAGRKIVF